jgi:hypothetical protein
MLLWPNKGDADTRPSLGSGYERVEPVTPQRPAVPAGALGELRLGAKHADVIPEYPSDGELDLTGCLSARPTVDRGPASRQSCLDI